MKYDIKYADQSTTHANHKDIARSIYTLTDENGAMHLWVEWESGSPQTRYVSGYDRYLNGAKGSEFFEIDVRIPLNKNDPQESIDKIKKLVVLK